MLKPKVGKLPADSLNGQLLVDVAVTMAVQSRDLSETDTLIERVLSAFRDGDFEELARLHAVVRPAAWQPWVEYEAE